MRVKPFRGLRPRADLAARIPSLPYDVVSSEEARALAEGDPHTFLHVLKPEIDLDPSIDPYDDRVYEKARESFRSMIERGWLVRDERPALYVYRLTLDEHRQAGIMGAAAIDDYLEDRIKKHEHTRPDKERDRTRHMDVLGANVGPVFLTYRGTTELQRLVDDALAGEPTVEFTAPGRIRHELWVVDEAEARSGIEEEFGRIPCTYVADGHHRAASAVNVAQARRAALREPTGREPSNYFLAVHFPADQVRILDYNRLVRDLHGLDAPGLVASIRQAGFEVSAGHGERRPPRPKTFGMYLDGDWYLLTAGPDIAGGDVASSLDVSVLTGRLLQPILGIGDPRTDRRIEFVGGIRGMDELERRVDSGEHAVAFALYSTGIEQVMAVADAGKVMPPKSTWFEPKLRSGLVILPLDGDTL